MAAPKPPFPTNASTSPQGPDIGPEQKPDATHDGAPAGEWFGSDLPQNAVPGGSPMTLGGYSPERGNPPLPADPMDGYTKPPTGPRR